MAIFFYIPNPSAMSKESFALRVASLGIETSKFDEIVKSLKKRISVIPANPGSESGAGAGIQGSR